MVNHFFVIENRVRIDTVTSRILEEADKDLSESKRKDRAHLSPFTSVHTTPKSNL